MSLKDKQLGAYNNLDNYKILTCVGRNAVVVYFSSHNLFYPDTLECFEKAIYEKDRYEWSHRMIKRASKHIFVRDIYKIWYQKGINAKINSIPKLADFLRQETSGFDEIIMVGSSAGGYAASLFGSLLNADIILDFNGQWEIVSPMIDGQNAVLKSLYPVSGKYYDLVPILEHTQEYILFCE